ncbi:MAG TPA: HAD family hydrolase [Deltaproteobacteria bacterium]|nr:HAD family hydrolase [Deltaproteobacteria bacterium]HCP47781.1 HAD family hydrolase [Deltaproteobacteria bacterium]
MLPIAVLPAEEASVLEAIFFDIDGTITDGEGRIPSQVFQAMERAQGEGLRVVPVTGRPAGWCDLIARTWPVDAVVGENGGLIFRRTSGGSDKDRMERVFAQDEETRRTNRARLDKLAEEVLRRHPGARMASDQSYREFDIAVDFCEDVRALAEQEVDAIIGFLEENGCHVKLSNIHVNAWFGDFDKASMCQQLARDLGPWELSGADRGRVAFFGDSPNDAPLFDLVDCSIGVANLKHMVDRIKTPPRYVTTFDGARGFVEGVDHLLQHRNSS